MKLNKIQNIIDTKVKDGSMVLYDVIDYKVISVTIDDSYIHNLIKIHVELTKLNMEVITITLDAIKTNNHIEIFLETNEHISVLPLE